MMRPAPAVPPAAMVTADQRMEVPPVTLGDALAARDTEVFELSSVTPAQPHRMTPFARIEGTRVSYP